MQTVFTDIVTACQVANSGQHDTAEDCKSGLFLTIDQLKCYYHAHVSRIGTSSRWLVHNAMLQQM